MAVDRQGVRGGGKRVLYGALSARGVAVVKWRGGVGIKGSGDVGYGRGHGDASELGAVCSLRPVR